MEDFTEQRKPRQDPQESSRKNNQAVHDFLAFEDSDDDDFGVIIHKKSIQVKKEPSKEFSAADDKPVILKKEDIRMS